MGKYAGCLTSKQVCDLEVEEARAILAHYDVTEEDADRITGMIKEAYYQLGRSFASGRASERLFAEVTGCRQEKYFRRYLELFEEEQRPYLPEEGEEDEQG